MPNYGAYNPGLTAAIKRIATTNSEGVYFVPHSEEREILRDVDHSDSWTCLCRGKAYGPELVDGKVRANMVHLGVHVRLVIGGLDAANGDWSKLTKFKVISTIKV